jgi:hypothetical protein
MCCHAIALSRIHGPVGDLFRSFGTPWSDSCRRRSPVAPTCAGTNSFHLFNFYTLNVKWIIRVHKYLTAIQRDTADDIIIYDISIFTWPSIKPPIILYRRRIFLFYLSQWGLYPFLHGFIISFARGFDFFRRPISTDAIKFLITKYGYLRYAVLQESWSIN